MSLRHSIRSLILIATTAVITLAVSQVLPRWNAIQAEQGPAPVETDLTPEEQINVRIYQDANRAVVNITTRSVQQDDMFMMAMPREGSGSGAVLDKQGHIVTNYHVVEDARQVTVNLFDGSSYRAELVGVDPSNELAVLRIKAPAEKLFPIKWGDSSRHDCHSRWRIYDGTRRWQRI